MSPILKGDIVDIVFRWQSTPLSRVVLVVVVLVDVALVVVVLVDVVLVVVIVVCMRQSTPLSRGLGCEPRLCAVFTHTV